MMSAARANALLQGLSSMHKKIFEAVPHFDPSTLTEVMQALGRRGAVPSKNQIVRCLSDLEASGLILHTGGNVETYVRVEIAMKKTKTKPDEPDSPVPVAAESVAEPEPAKPTPLDLFATLSARAQDLAGQMRQLAHDIESAVLEVEAERAREEASLQKLKKLQAVLKELEA